MKKTKKSRLNSLLENLLKEDQPAPMPKNSQQFAPVEAEKFSSLDQVIDRYLIRYEKDSIPTMDSYESELYGEGANSLSTFVEGLLNEAEDDELNLDAGDEDAPADDAPAEEDAGLDLGGDLGGDEPTDNTEDDGSAPAGGDEKQVAVANTPQINLNDFARSVARLINNYDQLINPKDIILNRVNAYIKNNYDERTAKELMDVLSTNYSLSTMETKENEQDQIPTSYTVGALSTG